MYGFGFSVGWKNLSLTAMFQGAAHVDAMLSGEGVLPFSQGSSRGNLLSNITDRWTEENPRQNAFYPRLSIGNINMNYEKSTWWLKDTDYLRLKNIELSYRLPDHWMKRIHLDNARIFIPGRKPSHVQLVQDLGRGTRRRTRRPLSEHRLRQSGRKLQFLNTDQP
ncbi:MAG: hypothetical protein ACLUYV_08745 [Alistipes shahii]